MGRYGRGGRGREGLREGVRFVGLRVVQGHLFDTW